MRYKFKFNDIQLIYYESGDKYSCGWTENKKLRKYSLKFMIRFWTPGMKKYIWLSSVYCEINFKNIWNLWEKNVLLDEKCIVEKNSKKDCFIKKHKKDV